MREIQLRGKHSDKVTLVDDDVYEWAQRWLWSGREAPDGSVYAQGRPRGVSSKIMRPQSLHRLVAGEQDSRRPVDHENHNTLDNQNRNLRSASISESLANRRKYGKAPSSQYKGVSYSKNREKWEVQINFEGRKMFIGYFNDEVLAARAYDKKAKELHKEFAELNFAEV